MQLVLKFLKLMKKVLTMSDIHTFKIAKVRPVKTPTRANPTDAGIDFFVPDDYKERFVQPNGDILIPAGIHVRVPDEMALVFFNKSGVATKKKLAVGACVVDSSYQGEIHLHLHNVGNSSVKVLPGEKIVQGLLIPISLLNTEVVDLADLYTEKSARGTGGFGSTGIS